MEPNPGFELTDSHCHLDFPDFDGQHQTIVDDAVAAGVTRMVSICTRLRQFDQVRALADKFPAVFFAAGTHPMHAAEEPMVTVDELLVATQHPKMVGIGETGLDYHYTSDSRDAQIESLVIHIEAARQTGLPLIIHARAADEDMARILTDEHAKGAFGCVMHCFSSSAELAATAIDLGFYLSMSGIATFKNSTELRDIFAAAPVDRILVETDSPYLAPTPHRGKRNEPAFTVHTAAVGADVFGMDLPEFAKLTNENFLRLFSKVNSWKATN